MRCEKHRKMNIREPCGFCLQEKNKGMIDALNILAGEIDEDGEHDDNCDGMGGMCLMCIIDQALKAEDER